MCSRCLKALSSIKISWHHINQVKVKSDQKSKYKYPLSTHNKYIVIFFYTFYEYFTVEPRSRYILWKWNVLVFEKLNNLRYNV